MSKDPTNLHYLDETGADHTEIMHRLATRLLELSARVEAGESVNLGTLSKIRINQLGSIKKLITFLQEGKNKGYFRAATGSGKTILFCIIARLLDEPTIIFVPRVDLIDQTLTALKSVGFSSEEVGVWGDGNQSIGTKVVLATYQSHISQAGQPGPYKEFLAHVKLVVCDEAHKSLGEKTREAIDQILTIPAQILEESEIEDAKDDSEEIVLQSLDTQFEREVLKLGFTATTRLANKDVADYFGELIDDVGTIDMMQADVLVREVRIKAIKGAIDRGTDMTVRGDVTLAQETDILTRNEVYKRLLTAYNEVKCQMILDGQVPRPIVSCSSIDEANEFADLARSRGERVAVYTSGDLDASTRTAQREKRIRIEKSLLDGSLDMVVTVDKLSEGWDFPLANIAVIARVITSPARIIQFVGRVLRSAEGKAYSVVIEVAWHIETNSKSRDADPSPDTNTPNDPILDEDLTDNDQPPEASDDSNDNDGPRSGSGIAKIGDKLGWMEALAQTGESIERIRAVVKGPTGESLVYDFGAKSLQNHPDEVRKIITAQISPTAWVTSGRRLGDIIPGFGLSRLGSMFGVDGNVVGNKKAFIALGRAIYGDNDPVLSAAWEAVLLEHDIAGDDIDAQMMARGKLIVAVKTTYPNSLDWLKLYGQDGDLVPGYGVTKLGKSFGFSGKIRDNKTIFIELGQAIYGSDDKALIQAAQLAQLEVNLTASEEITRIAARAQLIDAIKLAHPDGHAWLKLYNKNDEVVPGFGLTRLGSLFGIEGSVVTNKAACVNLGRAIYGNDDSALAEAVKKRSIRSSASGVNMEAAEAMRDDLIAAVREKYPDAASWMEQFQTKGEVVFGLGMIALGKALSVSGNTNASKKSFIALGRVIYGDDDSTLAPLWAQEVLVEELGSDDEKVKTAAHVKLVSALKVTYKDGHAWLECFAKRGEIIPGFGVKALAKLLKVDGNVQGNLKPFILLGRAIYGIEDVALGKAWKKVLLDEKLKSADESIRYAARAELISDIKHHHPDGAAWLRLFGKGGEVVAGFGITRLGSLFEIEGNVVGQKRAFVNLGKAIYGAQDPALAKSIA